MNGDGEKYSHIFAEFSDDDLLAIVRGTSLEDLDNPPPSLMLLINEIRLRGVELDHPSA